MKNVWILNHYAQTTGEGGGTRHFHFASYLKNHNWQATVIAANVGSTGRKKHSMNSKLSFCETIDTVSFLWLSTLTYTGNGIGRMLNMLSYMVCAVLPRTTENLPKPDAIIGSSVHPFAAVAGLILAKRHSVPFIFEVRDLWPQTLVEMGRLRKDAYLTHFLRKLEFWLYKNSTRIIVLLPFAHEYIVPLGIPKERVVWIPNGVDLTLFTNTEPPSKSNHPFTLMYFGSHGHANGLDTLLYAMKKIQIQLPSHLLQLRMIGDGLLKPHLIKLATELCLDNVFFESPIEKKKIPYLAIQADAFIIPVLDLPNLYRYGISMNKLFDYLASGRPIIIATNASNNPVSDAGAGLTIPPGNPDKLASAIIQICNTSIEDRIKFGLAGRKYAEENHDFNLLTKHLSKILDDSIYEYKISK